MTKYCIVAFYVKHAFKHENLKYCGCILYTTQYLERANEVLLMARNNARKKMKTEGLTTLYYLQVYRNGVKIS